MKNLRELINEFEIFKMTPVETNFNKSNDDTLDIDIDLGNVDPNGIEKPETCKCDDELENEVNDFENDNDDFNFDLDTPLDSFDDDEEEFRFYDK